MLAVPTEMRTGTWGPSRRETLVIAETRQRDNSNNSSTVPWMPWLTKQNKELGEDKLMRQRSEFHLACVYCLRILR